MKKRLVNEIMTRRYFQTIFDIMQSVNSDSWQLAIFNETNYPEPIPTKRYLNLWNMCFIAIEVSI